MKKRKREGKAQKRKRRNRERHAWRMGGGGTMTGQRDTGDPIGRDPMEGLHNEMVPFVAALAMRKYIRKGKKQPEKEEEPNAKS